MMVNEKHFVLLVIILQINLYIGVRIDYLPVVDGKLTWYSNNAVQRRFRTKKYFDNVGNSKYRQW